jgi:F-type H+-transporting ATPase subunit b
METVMSKSIRTTALAAAVSIGVALPALAADAGGSSGGMPQLDFGNPWTIAQVVWMLVIFGLLYYVMAAYALPQVASVLEARRQRIDGDLEAAQAAKQSADRAMAEHLAATAKARAEAQAAIAAASQAAQAEAAKRAEEMNARLNAQIAAAEARIDAARDSAMGALRQVATETTDALLQRLIGRVDGAAVEQAVGRELAARGRA